MNVSLKKTKSMGKEFILIQAEGNMMESIMKILDKAKEL